MEEPGDIFFCYAFLRRSDEYKEHGDVFFMVCPFIFLAFAPKIGMNRTEIILSSSSCNSSRFSGPCTHSYVKGRP
jgi:hypothetical protein